MTRSHKYNDRYSGDATSPDAEYFLPRYFAKHGFADADPKKTKKDGGGKGNWGHAGDELEDVKGVNMANARRRSNSSTHSKTLKDFKTKFETIEPEPVFEESMAEPDEEGMRLDHQSTTSSDDKSVEEDKA
ncbi:uncharacterized protein PV09_03916 [Verruconis gallopava]|uniref:Hyaluronan/mRNA-binding protein domain-containing protein n=1 Tax=Verruconis gallopava TaxID=253628 RepID=A0A0D2AEH9_9PEZI|nr:uncharacterized protein PV09_03916 [Verruconis gallopava]KIW05403.1 hypothetical protein PV09_03916 [Verruconis gallopava]